MKNWLIRIKLKLAAWLIKWGRAIKYAGWLDRYPDGTVITFEGRITKDQEADILKLLSGKYHAHENRGKRPRKERPAFVAAGRGV